MINRGRMYNALLLLKKLNGEERAYFRGYFAMSISEEDFNKRIEAFLNSFAVEQGKEVAKNT